jgi:hypothetical protein
VNLLAAQIEVRERGFFELPDDRLTVLLNQAKNTFEDFYPWPWLETVVTGTAPLTVNDLKQILYVRDSTNDIELLGLPAQQIIVGDDDIAQTGTPTHWWLDGEEEINVWPVSAVSLEVRYIKESPELAATTDIPLIPARYHNSWVDLAVIRAYIDSDRFAAVQGLKQIVDADLTLIAQRYATRNRQNGSYQTIRYFSEDW